MADKDPGWTPPPPLARSGAAGDWVASRHADAVMILSDATFEVPEAGPPGEVGTISWLRASVSRLLVPARPAGGVPAVGAAANPGQAGGRAALSGCPRLSSARPASPDPGPWLVLARPSC
ncbi:MAG TPA: hypothetical protein VGI74_18515 [Streptosporangiaceae bacterium]